MFATGARFAHLHNAEEHFNTGKRITETCYQMYARSKTGLGGEWASIINQRVYMNGSDYFQRPETIESLFYLWRYTHEDKYREYGIRIIDAMGHHITNEIAFHDINGTTWEPIDHMESFFLAETLKYLYLLYQPDHVIPLTDYVFNTEAHPISVRGKGKRMDKSKWVHIKTAEEYSPKVGSLRE
jgi:mannosyl-oligosaccharide alpha-1,2-mannosidase